ncbi:hypothetical protein GmHk_18G051217 [Glycine max]|nr:hypothetical protein GmHk_18G051217 [Glycine max]
MDDNSDEDNNYNKDNNHDGVITMVITITMAVTILVVVAVMMRLRTHSFLVFVSYGFFIVMKGALCRFGLDNTYKTNRYKLPLLDFVGVTPIEMIFSVGFAYLEGERLNNVVSHRQECQGKMVESVHWALKKLLQNSLGDLYSIWEAMNNMITL